MQDDFGRFGRRGPVDLFERRGTFVDDGRDEPGDRMAGGADHYGARIFSAAGDGFFRDAGPGDRSRAGVRGVFHDSGRAAGDDVALLDTRRILVIGIAVIFGLSVEIVPGLYSSVPAWIKRFSAPRFRWERYWWWG